MAYRIFSYEDESSFQKRNLSMARMAATGGFLLALAYSTLNILLFPGLGHFYQYLLIFNTFLFLALVPYSFFVKKSRIIYNSIFVFSVFSFWLAMAIAFKLNFNPLFIVNFFSIVFMMLFVMASRKALRLFTILTFLPALLIFFSSSLPTLHALNYSVMFGFGYVLSYVITHQRNTLFKKSIKNENILKSLLQSSVDAMLLVNYYSGKIEDVNKRTLQMFGFEDENKLIGQDFNIVLKSENFGKQKIEMTKQIERNGFYQTEQLFQKQNGVEFWGQLVVTPFYSENENFYLIQIRDIDENKKLSEMIKKNHDMFEFMVSHFKAFVYFTSYENGKVKFEYVSPYISKIFGVNSHEFIDPEKQKLVQQNYHPEDIIKLKKMKEVFRTEKKPVTVEYRFKPIGKDDYIHIHEEVIPKLDENGNLIGGLGIVTEINKPLS